MYKCPPAALLRPRLLCAPTRRLSSSFNQWFDDAVGHEPHLRPDKQQSCAASELGLAHDHWQKNCGRGGGGLYLYGPVGQGKTMLMKFFEQYLASPEAQVEAEPVLAPSASRRRRGCTKGNKVLRCHYADFMLMVNAFLRNSALRELSIEQLLAHQASKETTGAAVYHTGEEGLEFISNKFLPYGYLMIDEVNINNISDALLFKRLLTRLWSLGIFTIMTSNVPPQRLYEGGLNRSQFEDFIPLLQHVCSTFCLDAHHDFRLDGAGGASTPFKLYNVPSPSFEDLKKKLLAERGGRLDVEISAFYGRAVHCGWVSEDEQEALVDFSQVCLTNCSPPDYISLAKKIPKRLWLANIPSIHVETNADELRRFVNLVDIFYERAIPIVYYAEKPPLYLVHGLIDQRLAAMEKMWKKRHELMTWNVSTMDQNQWIAAVRSICPDLTREEAKLIWDCRKGDTMTAENVQGLLKYYALYGTNEDTEQTKKVDETIAEYGDKMILDIPRGVIDVAFAVPRLWSRLFEASRCR